MSSVNKVILVGYLGRHPEVRTFADGNKIANISLATTERYRDKHTGNEVKKTEWHRAVLHGKVAGIAEHYLHKGSLIYLEGKLATRKWQAQDGSDRYQTEVHVYHGMQMLSSKGDEAYAHAGQPEPSTTGQSYRDAKDGVTPMPTAAPAPQPNTGSGFDELDDDLPF